MFDHGPVPFTTSKSCLERLSETETDLFYRSAAHHQISILDGYIGQRGRGEKRQTKANCEKTQMNFHDCTGE